MFDLLDPPPDAPSAGGEDRPGSWEPSQLEHLALRFQAEGDEGCFEQLYQRAWKPVKSFLRRRGIPEKDLDDSTQDVLFRVYEQIGTYRREAPFEGWFWQIVVNVWKNQIRYGRTQKRGADEISIDGRGDGGDGGSLDLVELEEDPLMFTLAREQRAILEGAIEQLPPQMRRCLKLRLLRGLKLREISVALHIAGPTVKSHLKTGYQRLEPLLRKHAEVFEA